MKGVHEKFYAVKNFFMSGKVESVRDVEHTLAVIKPGGIEHGNFIEEVLINAGFEIIDRKMVYLTPEQASNFYLSKFSDVNLPDLITDLSSGPIIALVIARHRAVDALRVVVGHETVNEGHMHFPEIIKSQFRMENEDLKIQIHASSTAKEAQREIRFFFPEIILEPILTHEEVEKYLGEKLNRILIEGLSLGCQLKPEKPLLWLANFLQDHKEPKYRIKS